MQYPSSAGGRAPDVQAGASGAFPERAERPGIRVGNRYRYLTTTIGADKPATLVDCEVTSADGDRVTVGIYNVGAASPARLTFYDRQWNYLGSEGASRAAQYSPPLKYFDFPLVPGKAWSMNSTETQMPSGRMKTHQLSGLVGQWETVTVPAGTFQTLKVTIRLQTFDGGNRLDTTDESWYAPAVSRTVRSRIEARDEASGKVDQRVIELQQFTIGAGL